MSNNKQSSVEILCQKLANKLGLNAITFYIDHQEEIAEAKAIHKEEELELINFTSKIFELGKSEFSYALLTNEEILELYNKTFGGNNEF